MPKDWCVYIARCSDGLYYTGITNDLTKRLKAHNSGKGAVFTAGRRPIQLVYSEEHHDKSSARKREIQIKDWRREKKEVLIASRLRLSGQGLNRASK
jgi:putative endonuclease